MHTRTGALAKAVEAGEAGTPVAVGDDATDHVVSRGRDWNEIPPRVESGLFQGLRDVREAVRLDCAHVEHHDVPPAALELLVGCPSDDVARRELVDEALSILSEEQRSFAPDGLADEKPVQRAL